MAKLDRIDQKVIALLQADNQMTYAQMAEKAGVSQSTCRRRVQKLRRDGVIVADVSIINPEVNEGSLTVIALVTLERDTPDGHATFRRSMRALPQAVHCHFVTGACDYVIYLNLASMDQYDVICDRLFTGDPTVKRVDSLVVMKKIKEGYPGVASAALRAGRTGLAA